MPLAKGWTVELTKSAVRRVKDVVEPPAHSTSPPRFVGQDVGMVASATVARPVRVPDRYPCRAARRCKLHLSCRSRNYRIVPYARRATRIGDDVTQLTLAEAAKAAGRSKSALLRSIKAGRLSATRDALTGGGWVVEASELHRLYTLPREAVTDAPEMIECAPGFNEALDQIQDLRRQRDRAEDERRRAQEQLADQRAARRSAHGGHGRGDNLHAAAKGTDMPENHACPAARCGLTAPQPPRSSTGAGHGHCRATVEVGGAVRWKEYAGQYLRDVEPEQAHILVGARTYLVAIGELRPGLDERGARRTGAGPRGDGPFHAEPRAVAVSGHTAGFGLTSRQQKRQRFGYVVPTTPKPCRHAVAESDRPRLPGAARKPA